MLRTRRGAVLPIMMIVGLIVFAIGFFATQLMSIFFGAGGTQHEGDNNALRVAKQTVLNGVLLTKEETEMFGDVATIDSASGKPVILPENYNRCVGKVMLMRMNAKSVRTAEANANQLKYTNALRSLAARLRVSMDAKKDPTLTGVSYMGVGSRANLYVQKNQLPEGINLNSADHLSDSGAGKLLLRGYQNLDSGDIVALPMADQPRIVSAQEFNAAKSSPVKQVMPFNAVQTAIVKTGGRRPGSGMIANSQALLGLGFTGKVYPASFPHGVIVIDNGTAMFEGGAKKGNLDFWTDIMADETSTGQKGVEMFRLPNGIILVRRLNPQLKLDGLNSLRQLAQSWYNNRLDPKSVLQSIAQGLPIDGWIDAAGRGHEGTPVVDENTVQQLLADPSLGKVASMNQSLNQEVFGSALCLANHRSFDYDVKEPSIAKTNLRGLREIYNTDQPIFQYAPDCTAVEAYHARLLHERALLSERSHAIPGATKVYFDFPTLFIGGPVVNGSKLDILRVDDRYSTGLKLYPISGYPLRDSLKFPAGEAREGSLDDFIKQLPRKYENASGSDVTGISKSLQTMMLQIKPDATNDEIQKVMNTPIAFGKKSYVYVNAAGQLGLYDKAPTWKVADRADGKPKAYYHDFSLDGLANTWADNGFKKPFDGSASQGFGEDSIEFTSGTGAGNVLGIFKLRNRAYTGDRLDPHPVVFKNPA